MTGICFVVLFAGGVIPLGELFGIFADSDAVFDAYFANANNWVGGIISSVLIAASAFVLIWFLYGLREHIQPEHTDKATPNFMFASGRVTLRHGTLLYHILIGCQCKGTRICLYVVDCDVHIITFAGELLRHLTTDPAKRHQGLNRETHFTPEGSHCSR